MKDTVNSVLEAPRSQVGNPIIGSFIRNWTIINHASFQNPSFSLIVQKYQKTIQDLNTFPLSAFGKNIGICSWGNN
jgi:hypothetical protein